MIIAKILENVLGQHACRQFPFFRLTFGFHIFSMVSPRIIFMGTPEFAVASLDAICKAGLQVVAVVTAPDRPAGRGMKLTESAVKRYAISQGLDILQPLKLKDPEFLEALRAYRADLQVVVAFRMLPERVWNMPPMGTINLHGSLLPKYRGAAPINWAIINGEKETGVTTFKLKHEIDTGDILCQERFDIGPDETAGELHDRMKEIGARVLVETIRGLVGGTIHETPQTIMPDQQPVQAPKLFTEHCRIDWARPAREVHDLIRGLSPVPGAFTILNGKMLKIHRSLVEQETPTVDPGMPETDGKRFLRFACTDGYLSVLELQAEGKKRMGVEDFLRGFHL
jgi:methionyl-tRNA formyltransferase